MGEAMKNLEALERLARLRESGALTDQEFLLEKQHLLSGVGEDAAPRTRTRTLASDNDGAEAEIDEFRGSTTRWLFGSFAGWLSLALCAVGIGFLFILARWFGNISTRYELTDQRLIVRTGIIFKRIDEIELFRVKDVRVDFSLLNQMCDIGVISFRSSDATSQGQDFVLQDIPHARQRRETLRRLVDHARQKRRVREFDIDDLN